MQSPTGLVPYQELRSLAQSFYDSGMFPDIRSAAQAIVKISAGQELGFPPIYSMTKVYIVKGKVAIGAEMLGAMVKRSNRYDYRVVTLTDTECELMFTDKEYVNSDGLHDFYLSRFTIEDAKRADLYAPNSGWIKWPRAMLMSKALSQGARIVCPHLLGGCYVPEDFGLNVIEGECQEVTPETESSKTQAQSQEKTTPVTQGDGSASKVEQLVTQEASATPVPATPTSPTTPTTSNIKKTSPATPVQKRALDYCLKKFGEKAVADKMSELKINKQFIELNFDEAAALISALQPYKKESN